MSSRIVSLIGAFLLVLINAKLFAGPFDVVFKRMYYCDDMGENTIKYSIKLSKINRTHLSYTSNLTFPRGFHDSFTIMVEVSVFGNGGWQKNFMNFTLHKPCTDVNRFVPGLLESICKSAGINCSTCPTPPGVYKVKNWIYNIKLFSKIFPYNKYKTQITWIENGKIQTCFIVEVDIIPKANVKG